MSKKLKQFVRIQHQFSCNIILWYNVTKEQDFTKINFYNFFSHFSPFRFLKAILKHSAFPPQYFSKIFKFLILQVFLFQNPIGDVYTALFCPTSCYLFKYFFITHCFSPCLTCLEYIYF